MSMSDNIKVTYFFRKPQAQYFSIERVFEQVLASLPEQVSPVVYTLKNGANGFWGRLRALAEVRKNGGAVNHITGDITFVALALPKKGLVVTYHDLESLTQFTGWRFKLLKYLWVTLPVKRAQIVTSISEHTKEQLIKWTGCNSGKIVVVPNPLPEELKYAPKVFNADNPVILVMGTKDNKNVEGVFRAVSRFQSTVGRGQGARGSSQFSVNSKQLERSSLSRTRFGNIPSPYSNLFFDGKAVNSDQSIAGNEQILDGDKGVNEEGRDKRGDMSEVEIPKVSCKVLLVGEMTQEQKELADQLNLEVENLVQVPYELILDAYKRCDMLCFPSFYEGFGLPIVEAQAIGRPVITSNFGAMKEVAGEGAILVCPNKVEEIAEAIDRVIVDEEFRDKLIQAGLKNVERFDAKKVARMYAEVYRVQG